MRVQGRSASACCSTGTTDRIASAPAASAILAQFDGVARELEPAPAMTGNRPRAASTAMRISCRARRRVERRRFAVVPQTTSAVAPS